MKILIFTIIIYFVTDSEATVTCDFERDACGWTSDDSGTYTWERMSGVSGPGLSIPSAHSGDFYMMISSQNFTHMTQFGVLKSPMVALPFNSNITFWLYNYGKFGHLKLYLGDGNTENMLIWSSVKETHLEEAWVQHRVPISAFSEAQLFFNGSFDSQKTYYLGLDDIFLDYERIISTPEPTNPKTITTTSPVSTTTVTTSPTSTTTVTTSPMSTTTVTTSPMSTTTVTTSPVSTTTVTTPPTTTVTTSPTSTTTVTTSPTSTTTVTTSPTPKTTVTTLPTSTTTVTSPTSTTTVKTTTASTVKTTTASSTVKTTTASSTASLTTTAGQANTTLPINTTTISPSNSTVTVKSTTAAVQTTTIRPGNTTVPVKTTTSFSGSTSSHLTPTPTGSSLTVIQHTSSSLVILSLFLTLLFTTSIIV